MRERFAEPEAFMEATLEAPVVVDQWQLEKLALVCARQEVHYYVPGLPERYRRVLWGKSYASAEEAIAGVLEGLDGNARVVVIPEGPYVLARVPEPAVV